jgi:hypothetical protein
MNGAPAGHQSARAATLRPQPTPTLDTGCGRDCGDEAVDFLLAYTGDNEFILDVKRRFEYRGKLSVKQAQAILKARNRDIERSQRIAELREQDRQLTTFTQPVPEGRHTVDVEIVSAKWHFGQFGESLRIIVKWDLNTKALGNLPRALREPNAKPEDYVGKKLRLTATFQPKEHGFGFFQRAKAEVIS